jgi:hypothetical protein
VLPERVTLSNDLTVHLVGCTTDSWETGTVQASENFGEGAHRPVDLGTWKDPGDRSASLRLPRGNPFV